MVNAEFWKAKRVFLTGHTGFKGGWLALWLDLLGAQVAGLALAPDTEPSLYELCRTGERVKSQFHDVTDLGAVTRAVHSHQPEIIFHLAAQPLVLRSYQEPVQTLSTNIMGTVHLLEAARTTPSVRAVVVVTSDKCYQNRGWIWGYREDEPMGGRDPYSASKGCTELVCAAYRHSFFRTGSVALATARAGNVIGGGDWAADRIVPDAIRAFIQGDPLPVRHPGSVRPWQHVLEPLAGYLMLAERLAGGEPRWQGGWNFGPAESDAIPVGKLANLLVDTWAEGVSWQHTGDPDAPHEEAYLKLDSSKARQVLGWHSQLRVEEAVDWTASWYKQAHRARCPDEVYDLTRAQIQRYMQLG